MLGEHERIIRPDVEYPAAALDEFGIKPQRCLDPGRQTGGPGQVVSFSAIGNGNVHGSILFENC